MNNQKKKTKLFCRYFEFLHLQILVKCSRANAILAPPIKQQTNVNSLSSQAFASFISFDSIQWAGRRASELCLRTIVQISMQNKLDFFASSSAYWWLIFWREKKKKKPFPFGCVACAVAHLTWFPVSREKEPVFGFGLTFIILRSVYLNKFVVLLEFVHICFFFFHVIW